MVRGGVFLPTLKVDTRLGSRTVEGDEFLLLDSRGERSWGAGHHQVERVALPLLGGGTRPGLAVGLGDGAREMDHGLQDVHQESCGGGGGR